MRLALCVLGVRGSRGEEAAGNHDARYLGSSGFCSHSGEQWAEQSLSECTGPWGLQDGFHHSPCRENSKEIVMREPVSSIFCFLPLDLDPEWFQQTGGLMGGPCVRGLISVIFLT